MKNTIRQFLLIWCPLAAATQPPDWVTPLLQSSPGTHPGSVPAEVLLDEERVEIEESGKVISTRRYAVRILQRSGRRNAAGGVNYLAGSEKVRDFDAWLIPPRGETKKLGNNAIADISVSENDLYNEARRRAAWANDDAEPAAIFALQAVVERRLFFLQESFVFQDRLPVRTARFILSLPQGWTASGTVLGEARVKPSVAGTSYTWEAADLPYIEEEAAMPSVHSLSPRLGVNLTPAAGKSSYAPSFRNWSEVSRWLSTLNDPPAEPDGAVRAKAAELTAGAASERAKIRAIAKFVQGTNYVSIQMGAAQGGGYRPNPAPEILKRLYGDCKDKAALMRSLLRAVGIDSHAVALYSSGASFVRPEWASPHQFNHMIVAVRLKEPLELPAVASNGKLGALLYFDPTDPLVPLGELPADEQDSHALIVSAEDGALVRMPAPDSGGLKRTASITIASDASFAAKLVEISSGSQAIPARRYSQWSGTDQLNVFERRFSAALPGAAVKLVRTLAADAETMRTELELTSRRAVQVISPTTWLVAMGFVKPPSLTLSTGSRKHPVELQGASSADSFELELPESFDLDETPASVEMRSGYGSLSVTWTRQGRKLRMERRFELRKGIVPASEYADLRNFLAESREASSGYVVLVKQ